MRFALLQFPVRHNPLENYERIKQAIYEAKENNALVLLTQECALSGYPPIEVETVSDIDFEKQDAAFNEIVDLVKCQQVYLFLGLIRKCGNKFANSIAIIEPSGDVKYYDKRALWGWDADNFIAESETDGIVEINGLSIGVRVCFEVRFPEYFRELYRKKVDIAIVSLCDIQQQPDEHRFSIIKSHLLTRAIENVFTVIAVNSMTHYQTAPTGVFDCDGNLIVEAKRNIESITYFDYERIKHSFGAKGRFEFSNSLQGL
jgi:predicted amidohydrolase